MKYSFKKTMRTGVLLILVCLLLASNVVGTHAAEADHPLRKVRVGYLIYPGYQEGEGDEPKSGYGYEYLQQIAYYAKWEYEYVNGSFNELLEMLKRGEIDIMGDISYTEERAEYLWYAKEEQGKEYYYLFTREDRTDIIATEPLTLQGAKVGINKGSVQVEMFQQWCEKNKVECQIVLYESSADRYRDMNSGMLDATVSTSVAEKDVSKYRWNSIAKIGYSPYYFAVSKKNAEIYRELNDAISRILQADWFYNEKVFLKYNGNTAAASAGLDKKDFSWLQGKSEIKIGYANDALPYSDWQEDNNEMIGLLPTFIDHMKTRYDTTITPVKYDTFDAMSEALQQGEIDAIFPFYGSYWIAETNQMMVTGPLTSSHLMITYQGYYDEDTTTVIAVAENSPMQQFYVKDHFPDSEILFCQDIEGCLAAVANRKATCMLISADTYYAYRNELELISQLNISNTGYSVPISFAVRRDDVQMYKFLTKGLASITDADINEILIAAEFANPEMSVRQFLQKHVILVVAVFSVVLALILTLFIYFLISSRRTTRLSQFNSELTERVYVDFATGLPNKNKCEEILSSLSNIKKPTACFMLDLNDLKKVNDTLGHEVGDLMILNFAKLLRKVIPLKYFVGRFGGDEFIVIAEGISGKPEAEGMVLQIKEMLMKFNGACCEFQISCACGFAYSGDYPQLTLSDLLHEADIKMYEDKLRTKKQTSDL